MKDNIFRLNSFSSNIKTPNVNLKTLKKKNIVSADNSDMEKNFKLLIERSENHANEKSNYDFYPSNSFRKERK
jgi:hypothetical protein